jgi:hypothetical protein
MVDIWCRWRKTTQDVEKTHGCWYNETVVLLPIYRNGVMMTVQETIDSVRASFAMEGLEMTQEDERRGEEILTGERSVDDVIAEISLKYVRVS